jgi:transposase
MKQSKSSKKANRNRYTDEYKQEALNLADRVGVPNAAEQLGLAASQLYGWRSKRHEQSNQGDREQQVLAENVRLKRELAEAKEEAAILKKAAVYFAKDPKRGTPL